MGAVRADVVEAAQLPVLAAHDQDILVGDRAGDVTAGVAQLLDMPTKFQLW